MPDIRISETGFKGINESIAPELLPEGYLSRADHVIVEGGEIRLRPGIVNQLASVLPTAVYVLGSASDGAGDYLLVAANGKIRKWAWAANSTSLPTGQTSITVTPGDVQAAQGFGMFWIVDGVNGPRFFNGTAIGSLAGLDAPDQPLLELSHQTLISSPGLLTWSQNFITGAITTPSTSGAGDTLAPMSSITQSDSNFWDGSNLTGTALWSTRAGSPAYSPNVQDGNGANAVELDSDTGSGDSVRSGPLLLNAGNTSGYARVAVLSYEAAAEDATSNSMVVDADVVAYSDTGGSTPIAGGTKTWRSPFLKNDASTQVRQLVDIRGLSIVPRSIRVGFTQPVALNSNQGADVNRVALFVPRMELEIVKTTPDLIAIRQGSVQVWAGSGSALTPSGAVGGQSDPAQAPPGRLLTAGLQAFSDITAVDWSGTDTLALELTTGAGVSGLLVRLGLRSGGTIYWTQTLDTTLEEGWGLADLRDLQKNLTAVDRVIFEIREDVLIENLQEAGTATVCTVGALRSPGNLATGRRYWYRVVEIDSAGDASVLNTIESEGSKPSGEILPGYQQRRALLRLPAKKNPSATHRAIYRFGGGLVEDSSGAQPIGRLVAIVPFSSSTFAMGGNAATGVDPHVRAISNPYIAYTDAAVDTLVDNTPDGWLFGAETFRLGRDKPPDIPRSVAIWNQRVWLSTESEVFGSWLVESQQPAALYWSRINLPQSQDPRASEKGFWVRLPLLAGDSIVRLWPSRGSLLIFAERGVWALTGSSFEDYRLEQVSQRGLAAQDGITEHQGTLYWLTHEGLVKWPGQLDVRVQDSLPPRSGATASAYSASSLISTPEQLLVCVPTNANSTTADTVLCLGVRSDAWTKWPGLSLVGGAARPEIPVVALGTAGGQIALLKLSSGDGTGTTDINPRADTRPLGSRQEMLRPHHLGIDATIASGETLILTVAGDDPSEAAARTYQLNPRAVARFRTSHCPQGRSLVLKVTGATYGEFRLRRLTIEATPFSRRNY